MINFVENNEAYLPKPILVQHGYTPCKLSSTKNIEFIGMDQFGQFMKMADVIIMHAGAGSILHAISVNKKPLVLPRLAKFNEHINDHQLDLACKLHANGKVLLINDDKASPNIFNELNYANNQQLNIDNSKSINIISSLVNELLKA